MEIKFLTLFLYLFIFIFYFCVFPAWNYSVPMTAASEVRALDQDPRLSNMCNQRFAHFVFRIMFPTRN